MFSCGRGSAGYWSSGPRGLFSVNKTPDCWQNLRDTLQVRLYIIELVSGRYTQTCLGLDFHTAHVTTLRVTNEDYTDRFSHFAGGLVLFS